MNKNEWTTDKRRPYLIKEIVQNANNRITLQDIATILDCSRERVRQIINEWNSKYPNDPIIRSTPVQPPRYCSNRINGCKNVIGKSARRSICKSCYMELNAIKGYCIVCNKYFEITGRKATRWRTNRRYDKVKNPQNLFCSKKCAGKHWYMDKKYVAWVPATRKIGRKYKRLVPYTAVWVKENKNALPYI